MEIVTNFNYSITQTELLVWIPIKFLDAFVKLRKETNSFVMIVWPSVCLFFRLEQLGSHWTDFHEIWYLRIFKNLSSKFKFH